MKIEMYYLTRRQRCQFPSWSKKGNIFPLILRVVTFLPWRYNSCETAWFQQLNWRIRERLSQAINNGSWYKLSFLVNKDAMIVPATYIYSVSRFAQISWDMGPWNKHRYFRFYKLGVGKVRRDGPSEITGGGETVPPQKIPARETCLKKILQALIPNNNKLYALEKDYCRQAGFLKKFLHQNFFTTPPPHPSPAPIISNGPPLNSIIITVPCKIFEEILGLSIKYFCDEQENWFGRGWEEWGMSTGDTKTPAEGL